MKICPYVISVVPHDPMWLKLFAEEAARLKAAKRSTQSARIGNGA